MAKRNYVPTLKKITCLLILVFAFSSASLYGQLIKEMQFKDQPIVDILFALGSVGQKTIIPDDTVHGNASYYISNQEFDRALKVFLETYKLYLTIDGGIYYVSKIRIDYNPDSDKISIDAEEVNMRMIVDAIQKSVKKTVLYDTLPTILLTIHQKNIGIADLLNIIIAPAQDYKLETYPTHFYIKSTKVTATPAPTTITGDTRSNYFEKVGHLYNINKNRQRFKDLIYELFRLEGRECQIMIQRDIMIDETLKFQNKTFDQMLRLILEQANADYDIYNNIFYIFEIAQRDVIKKLKSTMIIQLKYVTAQDLQRLFPPDLGSSQFYRIDTNENYVILSGSEEEIRPIKEFIDQFDKPLMDSRYYRFDLSFLKASNIFNYLPESYKFQRIIQVPEANAFLMPLTSEKKAFLDGYLKVVDRPINSHEIRLKYIKSEDLLKKLPPSVVKEDIIDTQDPSIIFFKGTNEKYDAFMKELDIFDQPVPQIRYQVLVVSYNTGQNIDWQQNKDNKIVQLTASTEESAPVTASLGSLLGVNFDIPNILGFTVATNLNFALSTNNAEVITDTMINSLSGEKISFNDTEETKFVANATSTTTGGPAATGPVQSISTGFKLDIDGWVSGNEMITMKVNIELSNQGSGEVNIPLGRLPSTFNKTIQTKSRTKSGDPLKIGGLIRDGNQTTVEKIPFLGDIPILGYIFKREQDIASKSEIVIYILPHIVYSQEELQDTDRRLGQLYTKFFKQKSSGTQE